MKNSWKERLIELFNENDGGLLPTWLMCMDEKDDDCACCIGSDIERHPGYEGCNCICHKRFERIISFIASEISIARQDERNRIRTAIKNINTKTHACPFNDGEQNCKCYKAGINRVNRLLTPRKKI